MTWRVNRVFPRGVGKEVNSELKSSIDIKLKETETDGVQFI